MDRLKPAAAILAILVLNASLTCAQAPMMAPTPPMGWSTWNHFHHDISDAMVRAQADAMVSSGMRDASYVYVNIDGGWQGTRDAAGVLHPLSSFPDMKALGDYIHSKGLKFGLYSGPGPTSCGGAPTSYGYEAQDAKMFADWGVDFLKYDLCSFNEEVLQKQAPNDPAGQMRLMHEAYEKMGKALKATGRPIVYSFCQYGWDAVWEWAPKYGGNLWRTTGDIQPHWDSMYTILSQQEGLERYAGPGHWNDPDMLEVGNGKLSLRENRTHFSMWAMLSAPLLAGNDLPHMKPEIRDILTNKDVIAIDQDKLGQQARRAYSEGEVDVWVKHLAGGGTAIAVVDAGSDRYSTHPFHLSLARLGLKGPLQARDLWTGKEMTLTDNMPVEIKGHDVLLVKVGGKE